MEQKPMNIIKKEKEQMEQQIATICEHFKNVTGASVTKIEASFIDTTSIDGSFETALQEVRVFIEDV